MSVIAYPYLVDAAKMLEAAARRLRHAAVDESAYTPAYRSEQRRRWISEARSGIDAALARMPEVERSK